MKKKIIVLMIAAIPVWNVLGQSLHLLDTNKRWNTASISAYSGGVILGTISHRFNGDTSIQSMAYKKVLESQDSLGVNWKLAGFVREDSLAGLYFKNTNGFESMLYSYCLHVKDTFKVFNIWGGKEPDMFVKNIDTIKVNGKSKRRISLEGLTVGISDTWIEGLGSLHGILYPCLGGAPSLSLLCYYENEILIYKDSAYTFCYYNGFLPYVGVQELTKQFMVSPNPVYTETTIKFVDDKHRNLKLYNNTGMLIFSVLCSGQEYKLDISAYPAGVYYLVIHGGNSYCQKIVKY